MEIPFLIVEYDDNNAPVSPQGGVMGRNEFRQDEMFRLFNGEICVRSFPRQHTPSFFPPKKKRFRSRRFTEIAFAQW